MLSTAMKEVGELNLAQADGRFPTTVASGKAPGEGGVSILRVHFQGGVRLRAQPRRHLVSFHLTDLRIDCRIGGQTFRHEGPPGSLAICPAGIDCKAEADQSVEALFVAIDPGQLALAAAEDEALDARLIDRLSGYDRTLFDFAQTLALESGDGYPNGPLFWNDAASAFIHRLVARHTSKPERKTRGALSDAVLKRVKDYVLGPHRLCRSEPSVALGSPRPRRSPHAVPCVNAAQTAGIFKIGHSPFPKSKIHGARSIASGPTA